MVSRSVSLDPPTRAAIAACGAGLADAITAQIEAEYEKLRFLGNVEIRNTISAVFDANAASPDKYETYVQCILQILQREKEETACRSSCDTERDSCRAETKRIFELCIADQVRSCVADCLTYGRWSRAECTIEMCAWEAISQEARDFYSQQCKHRRTYINQEAECSADYGDCMADCATR